MNESGSRSARRARFFKLDPDAVLVVHDEGDFELGRLAGSSSAAGSAATTACARSRSS